MDSRGPDSFDEEAGTAARGTDRDSLFMQAKLVVTGRAEPLTVRVRNLSAGGMLAESPAFVPQGTALVVELHNVGPVTGRVVWAGEGKFGIAFDRAINPQSVRRQVVTKTEVPLNLSGLGIGRPALRRR